MYRYILVAPLRPATLSLSPTSSAEPARSLVTPSVFSAALWYRGTSLMRNRPPPTDYRATLGMVSL